MSLKLFCNQAKARFPLDGSLFRLQPKVSLRSLGTEDSQVLARLPVLI